MPAHDHADPDASRPVSPPQTRGPARWLLAAFALLCLVLGLIGVVVPGMPTTVFILLAAWAAARSSPQLHGWLMAHSLFGPMLKDWQNGGTVSRRAKRSATRVMGLCALLLPLTAAPVWVVCLSLGSMGTVLVWLWRRPEPGPAGRHEEASAEGATQERT